MHDASPHIKSTISKAHKLVSKMNKSTKVTEKLIKKSGKKLINACPTMWGLNFLISRLLEVKLPLNSVCEELGWSAEALSNLQWRTLEMTEKLLKPFAQYTTLTSGEENTTISSLVIPVLLELEMHLQDEVHM